MIFVLSDTDGVENGVIKKLSSILGVSKNMGKPPKWSILIGVSIVNHPFWGPTPIFGSTPIWNWQVPWSVPAICWMPWAMLSSRYRTNKRMGLVVRWSSWVWTNKTCFDNSIRYQSFFFWKKNTLPFTKSYIHLINLNFFTHLREILFMSSDQEHHDFGLWLSCENRKGGYPQSWQHFERSTDLPSLFPLIVFSTSGVVNMHFALETTEGAEQDEATWCIPFPSPNISDT